MTPQQPTDPRDARDLQVLAQREDGANVLKIARMAKLDPDLVVTILDADKAEFPDEPLRRRA